jgi:hypothetical protein
MLNKPVHSKVVKPLYQATVDLTDFIVEQLKTGSNAAFADTVFCQLWFYANLGLLRSPLLVNEGKAFSLAQIECVLEGLLSTRTASDLKLEIEGYRNESNSYTVDSLLESVEARFKPSNYEFFTRAQREQVAALIQLKIKTIS